MGVHIRMPLSFREKRGGDWMFALRVLSGQVSRFQNTYPSSD